MPSPRTTRRRRAPRAGVLAVAVVLAVSACGLRLETAPPAPLDPDAVESARQSATADAMALEALAGLAAQDADDAAAAVLTSVAEASGHHVDALGGIYVATPSPGPASSTPSPTTGSAVPEAAATDAAAVVALLDETAAVARADATLVPDAALARLLAAIATNRLLLAERLASTADVERPTTTPYRVPEAAPTGLSSELATAVIRSEDAAGLAWEVVAARRSDSARQVAARRADVHRDRAEAWAALLDVSGTGLDPRDAAYDLPDALVGAADAQAATVAVRGLEQALAATYATAVASVPAEERGVMIDALVDSARNGWPGQVPALPGMPDLTVG